MCGMAIKHDAITKLILQRAPEAITQNLDALHRFQVLRHHAGGPKTNRQQRTLGPGAPA